MATTPNMGMTLPTPTVTPGPLYATENNQAFNVVDSHDHTPGNGVPVPSTGININNTLPFNGFDASTLRSTLFVNQTVPLSLPTDVRSIYSVGGDLYYNNGSGQPIQITAGNALNAASIGGIGGDYTTSGASVFYTSATTTYTFWSASNTTGSIEAGPLTIRNNTLSSFGVTINAHPSISGNYNLVLPQSLPGSGISFLTVDPSGNMADVYQLDGSTIIVTSNVLSVSTTPLVDNITIQSTSNLIGVKPGSLNQSYFGPLGQQVSSSCGIFVTSNSTFITPTNLSVTITTTGRPVMLMVQSDGSGLEAYFGASSADPTYFQRWFRNSTTEIAQTHVHLGSAGTWELPISSFAAVDVVGAGTYTYECQIKCAPGQTINMVNAVIIAYEL